MQSQPVYQIQRRMALHLHPVEKSNHCGRRDSDKRLLFTIECDVQSSRLDENGFLIDNMAFVEIVHSCTPDDQLSDSCEMFAWKVASRLREQHPHLDKVSVCITPSDIDTRVMCHA